MTHKKPTIKRIINRACEVDQQALIMLDTEFRKLFDKIAREDFDVANPDEQWQNWSVERLRKAVRASKGLVSIKHQNRAGDGSAAGRTLPSPTNLMPVTPTASLHEPGAAYGTYQTAVTDDIRHCIDARQCRPIVFAGTGFSMRFFPAPSWADLLNKLCQDCDLADREFLYYEQKYEGDLPEVAEEFAQLYRDWAWGTGRARFPDDLFTRHCPGEIYIKHWVAKYIEGITPSRVDASLGETLLSELQSFQRIRPQAVITTNYDTFLEVLLQDYRPIIGEQVLHADATSIGDILKIHGCVTDPASLIFTQSDYQRFEKKSKYLSAKLLTYFAEHPLLFVGYSANDSNVQRILADIDEILAPDGRVVDNIYFLEWQPTIDPAHDYPRDVYVTVGDDRHIRLKRIVASDFNWVFEAFGYGSTIDPISVRVLRNVLSRVKTLITTSIPMGNVHVDYDTLANLANRDGEVAKLFGICPIGASIQTNALYRYTLTQVAQELGYDTWHGAHDLICKIKQEKRANIKASENIYHHATMREREVAIRTYSDEAVALLRKVQAGQDYVLDPSVAVPSVAA